MTNELADEIASKHDIGSGSYLRRLHKRAYDDRGLARKVGSGRPRARDYAAVNRFMTKLAVENNYVLTTSFLLHRVKEEFGYGSKWLLGRIMEEFAWTKVWPLSYQPMSHCTPTTMLRVTLQKKQRAVPCLTEKHKAARLAWCRARLTPRSLYGAGTSTVHVHLDEKYFLAFKLGKLLYLPAGVEPPSQELQSKTKIPSVMFLAAVAYPR